MAIEVRVLEIKASVMQEGANGKLSQANSPTNNSVMPNEEIINSCIEKVLEILKDKHER
jgi:hypothetical protein